MHSIRALNPKHILIILSNELDFAHIWLRGTLFFEGFPMRLFKWSPEFNSKMESAVVPMWIKLPELPVHLFDKFALFAIAKLIGKPLKLDAATASRTRLKERKEFIYLGIGSQMIKQKIIYENLPRYCVDCSHLGHDTQTCFENGSVPKPKKQLRQKIGKGKAWEPHNQKTQQKGKEPVQYPSSPNLKFIGDVVGTSRVYGVVLAENELAGNIDQSQEEAVPQEGVGLYDQASLEGGN
ncbi:hypothetical protein Pfo_029212 [Paulownia fortunei]|nr:hypothetical protein Pfo_029212 [Paulownia fortunei]